MRITTLPELDAAIIHHGLDLWYNTLSTSAQDILRDTIYQCKLFLVLDGGKVNVYLNVAAAFGYETDEEYIPPQYLNDILELWSRYGFDGFLAWVAYDRQIDALLHGEEYYHAIQYLL